MVLKKNKYNFNTVVYPGTFDPITFGHLDIIKRASSIFSNLIIAVAINTRKKTLFTVEERTQMIRLSLKNKPNIKIQTLDCLLVDFLKRHKTKIVIRGLRELSDFEYEFQMALTNRKLYKFMETVFFMPDEKYSYLSSSMVKEIVELGGNADKFVPKNVYTLLKKKFNR